MVRCFMGDLRRQEKWNFRLFSWPRLTVGPQFSVPKFSHPSAVRSTAEGQEPSGGVSGSSGPSIRERPLACRWN